MAILPIIHFPHPLLKAKTEPVEGINETLEKFIQDMLETMYHAPGSGLAANQVGVEKQVLVADITPADQKPEPIILINPRIIELSPETETANEACLSVPDFSAEVSRALRITVLAKNLKGEDIRLEAEGWLARVLQHEIDHLNGTLYLDRISPLKRQAYIRRRKKELARSK